MRCTSPLFAYQTYYDGELGCDKNGEVHSFGSLKFVSYREKISLEEKYKRFELLQKDPFNYNHNRYMIVSCGQCIGCRVNHAREWGLRCCLEAKKWKNNAFFTFTYDPEHVPLNEKGIQTLRPEDLDRFWDNFRSKLRYKYNFSGVRFLACGEYGDNTFRPHYHAVVFNLPDELFEDLTYYRTIRGVPYYNSQFVDSCWISSKKDGSENLGYVVISTEVNFKNACYVARYVVKKQTGDNAKKTYEDAGIYPVFMRCSNRPGIARAHFDAHYEEIYKNDEIFIDGAGKLRPPRYFDKLYNFEDPEHLYELKNLRQYKGEIANKNRMKSTDKSFVDVLQDEELLNKRKLERLKREG